MEMIQVYYNEIVEEHPIAKKGYLSTLAQLSKKDYKKKDYDLPNTVMALDMDAYEKSLNCQADKTIDAAIGIANYSNGKKLSNQRLLLVELRMGYGGSGKNSKASDMKEKEIHTRELLSGSNLDKRCFFIFNKEVAPLRLSRYNREKETISCIDNWHILSPEQFNNEFFEVPPSYKISTPVDTVLNNINNKIKKFEYHEVLLMIKYWQEQERSYFHQHNLLECRAIQEMISIAIDLIRPFMDNDQPELDQFEFLLREESYINLGNLLKFY